MSYREERRGNLDDLIFDMEENVANLARWGKAVRDMGTASSEIAPDGIYVIGLAIVEAGETLKADWEQLFELSRNLRGGGR